MKRKTVLGMIMLVVVVVFLSGCSLFKGILGLFIDLEKETDKDKDTVKSPYKQPEVFCNYAHYFRARGNDFSQWWYPGIDPNRTIGPEPWRRDLWIGSAGDYPYIGPYDNVEDKEIMRWHIRLAKASGITAFLLAINDWKSELPQTDRLLDVAAEENFKIGFLESHSFLGAVPRRLFDGRALPILPRQYVGYDQIMEYYSQKIPIPQPPEKIRYIKPISRSLREVPRDALAKAADRIATMLKQRKSHPAYLRIDGKPMIMIPYMDINLTPTDLKTLFDMIEANVGEDLYIIALIPQVYWYFYPPAVPNSGITQEWANTGADVFTHWTPNGMIDASQTTRLKATRFNVKDSLKWRKDPMIPIMPGFDDDAWRPGDEPAPTSPRNNGKAWSEQLEAALVAKPRFILIQAWNEWHEGSQIEPSTKYIDPATKGSDPYLYLRILAQKLEKPWPIPPPPLPPKSSIDPKRFPYL